MQQNNYRWRTDSASGSIAATDADAALKALIADGEWPANDKRVLADGAWLLITDDDGVHVLKRGTVP